MSIQMCTVAKNHKEFWTDYYNQCKNDPKMAKHTALAAQLRTVIAALKKLEQMG